MYGKFTEQNDYLDTYNLQKYFKFGGFFVNTDPKNMFIAAAAAENIDKIVWRREVKW